MWLPKRRKYLHFDLRLSGEQLAARACSTAYVAQHAFWPFIRFDAGARRYRSEVHKVEHKERLVYYAAHQDAAIFEWYAKQLGEAFERELAEAQLGDVVLAYRRGLEAPAVQAAKAFARIRELGDCTVLALDIRSFFDTIPHQLAKAAWSRVLGVSHLPSDHYRVFRAATRFAFVERDDVNLLLRSHTGKRQRICEPNEFDALFRKGGAIEKWERSVGVPQGNPIASVLSNMVLLEFDRVIHAMVEASGGFYRRYADDILVVVPGRLDETLLGAVTTGLRAYGFELQDRKTAIFEVDGPGRWPRPLTYLGLQYDGESVRLTDASVSRFYRKVVRGVRARTVHALTLQESTLSKTEPLRCAELDEQIRVRVANARLPFTLFTRGLWLAYAHVGKRNFYDYARMVERVTGSKEVKRQLRHHAQFLRRALDASREDGSERGRVYKRPWRFMPPG